MSAAQWATSIEPGTPVKWRVLEVAAFEPYPAVQEQLDPAGKYGRVRHSAGMRRNLVLSAPLMILIAALFLAPIAGFATLMGDRFGLTHPDPAFTVPAAGIIFGAALPLLVVSFALWLRAGRPKDSIRLYQAGIALVLGAYSAILIQSRGPASSVPQWQLWLLPVVADALIGGVFLVLLLIADRRRHAAASPQVADSDAAAASRRRVAEQISRLTPNEQAGVQADISAAVRDLAHRGVITGADGDWALGAELGALALRMSQSRNDTSNR